MGFERTAAATTNKDQFDHFWQQQGEWVEEPNQRRGGESGVQRLSDDTGHTFYAKRQIGHIYRSLLHPFGRPTVLREYEALNSFEQLGVRVPHIVYCGVERDAEHQWRALLVSEALEGFEDIDSWFAAGARERYHPALHERVLLDLAQNLVRMHRGHWQHGCLYGKHVFVKVVGEGAEARAEVHCWTWKNAAGASVASALPPMTLNNCAAIRLSLTQSGKNCSIFTRWRLAALSKV